MRLDSSHDEIHRTDYYLSPYLVGDEFQNLYFASITKREIETNKYEDKIRFVTPYKKGLEILANNVFDLPFDREKIFPTFDSLNE